MNKVSKENKIKFFAFAGARDFTIDFGSKGEIDLSWFGSRVTALTCDICRFENLYYINLCFIKVGICFKYYA